MPEETIRPIALCLLSHGDRILVFEEHNERWNDRYCRPLGGGIEVREHSRDAVIREIREELGQEITDVRLIGVVENIFAYEGQGRHEIVFIYDARFVDQSLYSRAELPAMEHEVDATFTAVWRSREEMRELGFRLVPDELENLLRANGTGF